MLTLFSIPKPFRGEAAVIQRNALGSWVRLRPACEIILLGEDDGVREAAEEFGVRHIPGVARNEYGTPLLDAAFALAERGASCGILAFVNADVMLLGDFLPAVGRVPLRRFLMAGQRWDVDLPVSWDFDAPDWEGRLRGEVRARGTLHPPSGSDYFVFPRGAVGTLPPFAVGRPGWDNWMISHARVLRIPVVDATACVTAVHQNHGYGHVKEGTGRAWEGPEADRNRALIGGAGGWDRIFVLDDATHVLTPRGIERALSDRHLKWRVERRAERHPEARIRNRVVGWLYGRRRFLPDPLWRRMVGALA